MKKRVTAILLSLCMVMALVPSAVFAAEPAEPAESSSDLSKAQCEIDGSVDIPYTGDPIEPDITVKMTDATGEIALTKDKDYSVSYQDSNGDNLNGPPTNVGKYKAKITGVEPYTGAAYVDFSIYSSDTDSEEITVTIPVEITVQTIGDTPPGEHTVELEFSPGLQYFEDEINIQGDTFTINGADTTTHEVSITGPEEIIEGIFWGIDIMLAETDELGWRHPDTQYDLTYEDGQLKIDNGNVDVDKCSFTLTYQKGAYNLYVEGTRVTTSNASDVLGDGTVSYDGQTNTLTLDNADIDANNMPYGIYAEDDLNIILEGKNSVNVSGEFDKTELEQLSGSNVSAAIYCRKDLTIRDGAGSGTGNLNASASAIISDILSNDWFTSSGIYAVGSLALENSDVEASGGDIDSIDKEDLGSIGSYGIRSNGKITVMSGSVKALAGDAGYNAIANSSDGIYGYDGILIEKGAEVNARASEGTLSRGLWTGGKVEIENSELKAESSSTSNRNKSSSGICASNIYSDIEYSITISNSKVTAAAGAGSLEADGIYAIDNITITDSEVTAAGTDNSASAPNYSGGIFSNSGDITISGQNTVVNADSGYAKKGVTGIGTEDGDIIISGGSVRAEGISLTGTTGIGNGFSAVRANGSTTGGDIIISGGNFAAAGATDSVYYGGELIARPDSTAIAMKVLDKTIFKTNSSDLDWDKMNVEASEIKGSPFTEETTVARSLTEGKQYFSGGVSADPTDPVNPAGQDGNAGKSGDGVKTGDDSNMMLWAALLILSGAAACGIGIYSRRRKME